MTAKLILGVATNSKGEYKATFDGKITKAYNTWRTMLNRAYCPKLHARYPTYIGCSVTAEWLEYQQFAEWYENHEYSDYGYALDKDLLIPGNKVYAPERCVFVPSQLNSLVIDCGTARGQYKQGVCFHKRDNKFQSNIRINGKLKHLGSFDNELDAFLAYKAAKESHVKYMANLWRDDIEPVVHHALITWQLAY